MRVALLLSLLFFCCSPVFGEQQTLIVSAEGLADARADIYQRDRGLMLDDLRRDARRQLIAKAVGVYVSSETLTENYLLVRDRVLTRSQGLIKRVLKESPHWVGEDGFAHLLIKAEVYLGQVRDAVRQLSGEERIALIREQGNPRIAVRVSLQDAGRSGPLRREPVAENLLKQRIQAFGYQVWAAGQRQGDGADFQVDGEVRYRTLSHRLQASGLVIEKTVLTSWSVACTNLRTGEQVYFNNQLPKQRSWNSLDAAMGEIGGLIGDEFSADFFADHLQRPSKRFQLQLSGLPDYDTGILFKREFIGLRPVLNVDFRSFAEGGDSHYEIEFAGSRENFASVLNDGVIRPLNRKLGGEQLRLVAIQGERILLAFSPGAGLSARLAQLPPASLATAGSQRLSELVKDQRTLAAVGQLNPEGVAKLGDAAKQDASAGKRALKDF